ncbi:MAG: hypothetical protein M8841_02115 [marine benthic group bacterium]|jgi:hypothetical protein|nr:hypothetical protein [Gemmatimonadota bacterium]MCL7980022.1 hypothetical protein [Gemmatimonadota bacterium]MCL7990327.1 hypothetical protein [Gemmatimonadota bacterium]
MSRILTVFMILGLSAPAAAPGQDGGSEAGMVSVAEQIEGALLAAPASLRSDAEVLGSGGDQRDGDVLTTLRAGTNGLICIADDPEREGFHAACYHESLDPYMRLGRRGRDRGLDRSEIMESRYEALRSGALSMPASATLFSVNAESLSAARLDPPAEGLRRLTVVYLPGATLEGTGLPGRPEDGIPWLMLPDTPWAHIMISH